MNVTPPSAAPKSRPEFLIVFALLAAGLAIYARTLGYGFISFDDPGYVYDNPHVAHGLTLASVGWAFTTVAQSNWHPLTWLSLMADAQLYGLHAGGFHLTNLLLHLANGTLLFFWLRAATGRVWPPALTAFFFLVHPLHVESVAWVTERKDVLSTFFFCLTLLAYTRYAQRGGKRFYGAAMACYVLGLLAKPMLVTLPALLVLLDYWPLRRWGDAAADVAAAGQAAPARKPGLRLILIEKLPFLLLAVLSCAVTLIVQHHGAAVVPLATEPIRYRVAAACLGYVTYLAKTFYPVNLGIYYPFWRGQSYAMSMAWGVCLAAVLAGTLAWRRRLPWLVVGWSWFLGTMVPVIGLVQVGGQAVADRYTYLPHIGLFMLLSWTAAEFWQRYPAARNPLLGIVSLAAAGCLALSVRQVSYWRSSAALFEHTLQVAVPSGRLYHLLGDAFLEENRPEAAAAAYRQALVLQPEDNDVLLQLGLIDLREQRWAEAQRAFRPLAEAADATVIALNDDALALCHLGRVAEARRMYGRALQKDNSYALAHFGLADLLRTSGETAAAVNEYEQGLLLRDDWIPALVNLAWIDAQLADGQSHAAALVLAQHAVELTHGQDLGSLNALAAAEAAAGSWDQALAASGSALVLADQPGSPAGAGAVGRERLECYRKRQIPAR